MERVFTLPERFRRSRIYRTTTQAFEAFRKAWCREQEKVPHTDPDGDSPPGSVPKNAPPGPPLTAVQQQTYDSQQLPENRWVLHPEIDGCVPSDDPDQPPGDPSGGLH